MQQRPTNKTSRKRNSETWWRRTVHYNIFRCFIWDLQETSQRRANGASWICNTETSLGVSLETFLRHRVDVLIGRRCYVLLRHCYTVPIRRCGDLPLRRLGDAPVTRCWVFHLRRTCDVTGTYRETSLRRRDDILMQGRSSFSTKQNR